MEPTATVDYTSLSRTGATAGRTATSPARPATAANLRSTEDLATGPTDCLISTAYDQTTTGGLRATYAQTTTSGLLAQNPRLQQRVWPGRDHHFQTV